MDTSQNAQALVNWLIGGLAAAIITSITGIFAIIKASRMMPKELKGADLNNRSKEISIADQYDELATRAADKAIRTQERLDKIEDDYKKMKEEHEILLENYEALKEKVETQEIKIKEQDEEIEKLRCELNNSKLYNDALIKQMKEANIIPIEKESLPLEKCKETKNGGKKNGK